jgi:hypothetical protein
MSTAAPLILLRFLRGHGTFSRREGLLLLLLLLLLQTEQDMQK